MVVFKGKKILKTLLEAKKAETFLQMEIFQANEQNLEYRDTE